VLHYFTVHAVRRDSNVVDNGLLTFIRHRISPWRPSRRFEYAMEKSVLILSDTQLVTGLGILVSGFSQLKCGISAYHWQIMVFLAWFASFSFLSAMTFLEGYFQTNNNMRLIRVCFMVVLASLLILALLPTGSDNFLDLFPGGEGYYPGLSTACFYRQLMMGSFVYGRGPKIWSVIFSIFVIVVSYLRCGMRLFDPGACISHKCLRAFPGSKFKQALYFLERNASHNGLRATLWHVLFLAIYAIFTCCRAFFDIVGSMLVEIIWLTFAIAWGTIKIWTTRTAVRFNYHGREYMLKHDISQENSWSFGQTLPLVLILLPLLSMAQAYLDNDAKAQDTLEMHERAYTLTGQKHDAIRVPSVDMDVHLADAGRDRKSKVPDSTFTNHNHKSLLPLELPCTTSNAFGPAPDTSPSRQSRTRLQLPRYPYTDFTSYPWYKDLIVLLLCQIVTVTAFSLWVLTKLADVMGISAIFRNRLFLIWVFGMTPLTSLVHLGAWYLAALVVVQWKSSEEWLRGGGAHGKSKGGDMERERYRTITSGHVVYWSLRLGLIAGCLMLTLFGSLEAASPNPLDESL
jgi:hypothetical protein